VENARRRTNQTQPRTAFWRESKDWNVVLDENKNVYYDHARATGGGPVSLVMNVLNCSASEAGRWLRLNFGSFNEATATVNRQPPQIWDKDAIEADAIRTALVWHVESQLELAKLVLFSPFPDRAALRVRRLSHQLERVRKWSDRDAMRHLLRLAQRRPQFVAHLHADTEEFQTALAHAIKALAIKSKEQNEALAEAKSD
jgi:hypothetical protein